MALEPTWEVKDGSEWGWRHMCPWENGHPSCGPCTQQVVLGRAGLQSEDCQASSKDLKGWEAGENERWQS